jgi:hypothetical protein
MDFIRMKDIVIDKSSIDLIMRENNGYFMLWIYTKDHGLLSVTYESQEARDDEFDIICNQLVFDN